MEESLAIIRSFGDAFAVVLGVIGGLIIIVGAAKSFYVFLVHGFPKQSKRARHPRDLRQEMGRHLIFGLEFFIARDVLVTIVVPSWNQLGQLGALVLIRTILSFFLMKELRNIEDQA